LWFSGVPVSFEHVQPLQTTVLHLSATSSTKKMRTVKGQKLGAEAASATTRLISCKTEYRDRSGISSSYETNFPFSGVITSGFST